MIVLIIKCKDIPHCLVAGTASYESTWTLCWPRIFYLIRGVNVFLEILHVQSFSVINKQHLSTGLGYTIDLTLIYKHRLSIGHAYAI